MKHILTLAALVFATACLGQGGDGYNLEIETVPAQVAPGFVHKFYVTANHPADKISAVFGNDATPLVISAPEGIYNEMAYASWNASYSPSIDWIFPPSGEDSFATIELDGPAGGFVGAEDPSLVEDPSLSPAISTFFEPWSFGQFTELNVNTLTGGLWYVSYAAANALPGDDGRWLIMQLTSTGPISGMLNVHLFPLGVSEDQVTKTFEFGVFSCSDESACNYDPNSSDDLFCDYSCCPGPGCCGTGTFWDESSQTCLASPVPPSNTNPSDVNMDGCVGIDDFLVHLSNFGSGCGAPQWACGDDVTFLGDEYATVQIGGQCWFQENLRYLPSIHPGEYSTTNPRYYVYGYDGLDLDLAKQTESYQNHGVLYNWPAAMQAGICPVGWRLPSISDFGELIEGWGGAEEAGLALWSLPFGNNNSQFSGLPAGRVVDGLDLEGSEGAQLWLWTSDESSEPGRASSIYMDTNFTFATVNDQPVANGHTIRCLKDSE